MFIKVDDDNDHKGQGEGQGSRGDGGAGVAARWMWRQIHREVRTENCRTVWEPRRQPGCMDRIKQAPRFINLEKTLTINYQVRG